MDISVGGSGENNVIVVDGSINLLTYEGNIHDWRVHGDVKVSDGC